MSNNIYPRFLIELLAGCPQAGDGVHHWLFRVARYLHKFHPHDEICKILAQRTAYCGRAIAPHEIIDAVRNSSTCAWNPDGKTAAQLRAEWNASPQVYRAPIFKPELAMEAAAAIQDEITPEWLSDKSPLQTNCHPKEFFARIFEPEEKVLVFTKYRSQGELWPSEKSLDSIVLDRCADGYWFLSNPVDGREHWNPRILKNSRRSEESVTAFRYAVLECDQKPKEVWLPVWLKILVQLALPIVSITDSAGKSAHALVRVAQQTKADWDKFKRQHLRPLVPLGADDSALSAVRLTRLPNAYRGSRLQQLLYFSPDADGTPIFAL